MKEWPFYNFGLCIVVIVLILFIQMASLCHFHPLIINYVNFVTQIFKSNQFYH
jgi:hypothetical protein